MANDYTRHSRFFYSSYRDIEDQINVGNINQFDVVLCSDSREMLLVTDQLELVPIQSRVYRFTTISSAESFLNSAKDTYQGQLVSILNAGLGSYQAYVVNKNNAGRYYVSPISIFNSSDIDYNEIGNRPIEQIGGTVEAPVSLSELPDGLYKVEGAYKVCDGLVTIFQSHSGDIISVMHNVDDTVSVKVITANSITDYLVNSSGDVIDRGKYITKEWIELQGYASEAYLDAKLEAMNLITRDQALQYIEALIQEGVENRVNQILDDTFNQRFDQRLREQLVMEDQENIQELFE